MEAEIPAQPVPVPHVGSEGVGCAMEKGALCDPGRRTGCQVPHPPSSVPVGRAVLVHSPGRLCPGIELSFLLLAGEQTKALVTQLTLFNRVLTELREDIRDQVGLRGY